MPNLSQQEIEKNFEDINPKMTKAEARAESSRCLNCWDAPCIKACPTHIDVPSFIKKISTENMRGAARTILDANPLGGSCARVCPVEVMCEGACVEKTLIEKPIEIARLQRYATDFALQMDAHLFEIAPSNGKSIGIVGSGPAGLACSIYLARLGYGVTVYERKSQAGGLNTYGMAEYKLTQEEAIEEVGMAEKMGIDFRLKCEIGFEDSRLLNCANGKNLLEEHDAIFLAVGLGTGNKLGIKGEENACVYNALDFIDKVKTRDWDAVPISDKMVVIGAGNTAIDVATQAKRLGAERVTLIYRKTPKEMSAYEYEYELAKQDGVEFMWQAMPFEIKGEERVEGLVCKKTDGSERLFEIDCEMIIKAIGQKKHELIFGNLGIEVDGKGRVLVDEYMQTSNDLIFAGGDCVNGGAEAVDAAQAGKMAAAGIHRFILGEEVLLAGLK